MSRLKIRTKGFDEITVNAVSFMSPIFASVASSQTQGSEQHHPIRAQQPNIRFDVIWASEKEYEAWQTFVRSIQLKLLKGKDPNDVAVVTLWWPERNIENWQGLIKETDGGGQKFNWAPQGVIEVELTKGLIATSSALWSYGTNFDAIYGGDSNTIPKADSLIQPPMTPSNPGGETTSQNLPFNDFTVTSPPVGSTGAAGSLGSLFGTGTIGGVAS